MRDSSIEIGPHRAAETPMSDSHKESGKGTRDTITSVAPDAEVLVLGTAVWVAKRTEAVVQCL